MSSTILLTAAIEDIKPVTDDFESLEEVELLHLPLEKYTPLNHGDIENTVFDNINFFENIVHGTHRNTKFFVQAVEQKQKVEEAKQALNLTLDADLAAMLEDIGIPAVTVEKGKSPIDMVEFMLRLRRLGPTLYPCGTHLSEDIPALLKELDIPVTELKLFELDGPGEEELTVYQKKVKSFQPDIIVFHNRRSVTRTLTAFPNLNLKEQTIITADSAVSEKLKQKNVTSDIEAEGSWESIFKKVREKM